MLRELLSPTGAKKNKFKNITIGLICFTPCNIFQLTIFFSSSLINEIFEFIFKKKKISKGMIEILFEFIFKKFSTEIKEMLFELIFFKISL